MTPGYDLVAALKAAMVFAGTLKGEARMLSVIEFLEKVGSDAQWLNASQEDLQLALEEMDIEEQTRSAILNRDTDALQALLNPSMLLAIMIPGAPDEEEEEEDEEEPGEKPSGIRHSLVSSSHSRA